MNVGRILLECGNTLVSGNNSGIQRVSRNLARQAIAVGAELGVTSIPIIKHRWRCYDGTRWLAALERRIEAGNPQKPVTRTLESFHSGNSLLKRLLRFLRRGTLQSISSIVEQESLAWQSSAIHFQSDDLVISLDVWWTPSLRRLLQQAHQQRAQTGIVVYDLLPITHPQFFPSGLTSIFQQYLDHYLKHADVLMVISQTVQNELRKYAKKLLGDRAGEAVKIEFFRLGSDLDLIASGIPSTDQISDSARQVFAQTPGPPPYLSVGTLEPRKNHNYLLDAFEQIWDRCPQTRLCIVGRPGWLCGDLLDRIHHHPRFGHELHLLTNASDADLAYCYQHARALVFSSHAEGFGLPLIEGLRNGLPVLASDIPVHREVGGESCLYFDIGSPSTLAQIVIDREQTGAFAAVSDWDPSAVISWRDSTRQFLQKCRVLAESVDSPSIETPDTEGAEHAVHS